MKWKEAEIIEIDISQQWFDLINTYQIKNITFPEMSRVKNGENYLLKLSVNNKVQKQFLVKGNQAIFKDIWNLYSSTYSVLEEQNDLTFTSLEILTLLIISIQHQNNIVTIPDNLNITNFLIIDEVDCGQDVELSEKL